MSASSRRAAIWTVLFLGVFVLSSLTYEPKAEARRRRGLFGRRRLAQSFRNRRRNRRRLAIRRFNRFNPFLNDPFLLNPLLANQLFNANGALDPLNPFAGVNGGLGGGFGNEFAFNGGLGGLGGFGGIGYGGLGGFGGGLGRGFSDPRALRLFARNGGGVILDPRGNAFELNPQVIGADGNLRDPAAQLALSNGDISGLFRDGAIRQQLYRTSAGMTDQIMPAFGKQQQTLPETRKAIQQFNGGVSDKGEFLQ